MTLVNNTTTQLKNATKLKSKFSISSILLSCMIIVIMLMILFDSVTYAKSVIKGLTLFFTNVLPGLLPFMFLVKLLTNLNVINKIAKPLRKPAKKLFGVSEYSIYAFLMSIISGYPIGSKITSDLYLQGKISDEELTKSAILSSTAGSIFVVGSVGGLMLKSVKLGFYIYFINILSVMLTSFILNIFSKNKKNTPLKNLTKHSNNKNYKVQNNTTLSSLTQDTTISLLSVGFYIALFTLIIDLLTNLKIFSFIPSIFSLNQEKTALFQGVMSGIIEMTNGTKLLSSSLTPISISFICAIISFSGLSIIMQSLSFLSSTPLKAHHFILGKLLQAIVCFIISMIFSFIIL